MTNWYWYLCWHLVQLLVRYLCWYLYQWNTRFCMSWDFPAQGDDEQLRGHPVSSNHFLHYFHCHQIQVLMLLISLSSHPSFKRHLTLCSSGLLILMVFMVTKTWKAQILEGELLSLLIDLVNDLVFIFNQFLYSIFMMKCLIYIPFPTWTFCQNFCLFFKENFQD